MASKDLTAQRLRELLDYNPDAGTFTRRIDWCGRKAGAVVAGTDNGNGYRYCSIDGGWYALHRLVWLHVHGAWPREIDHINRVPNDNRLVNLREVSRAENQANRGLHSNNKSGYPGVSWNARAGKWEANIYHLRKRRTLGKFDDLAEAAEAYRAAKVNHRYCGHPCISSRA